MTRQRSARRNCYHPLSCSKCAEGLAHKGKTTTR